MRPRTTSRAEHEAEQERRQNVCAAIVCSVLGGALWRAVDIRGGPPGRHDYDLHFDDPDFVPIPQGGFTFRQARLPQEVVATLSFAPGGVRIFGDRYESEDPAPKTLQWSPLAKALRELADEIERP